MKMRGAVEEAIYASRFVLTLERFGSVPPVGWVGDPASNSQVAAWEENARGAALEEAWSAVTSYRMALKEERLRK